MTTLIDSGNSTLIAFEEEAQNSFWSRILVKTGSILGKVLDYLIEDLGPLEDDEYIHMSAWYYS